jgi:DNA-binding MarR family transcriptional regulator
MEARNMAKKPNNVERNRSTKTSTTSKHLSLSAADFLPFLAGLSTLASMAPERTSLSQMVFFLTAAQADLTGRPATFTDLKELLGEALGRSLHTTYRMLLEDKDRAKGSKQPSLGWLRRVEDRADNRRKYLHLTPEGLRKMRSLRLAMKGLEA